MTQDTESAPRTGRPRKAADATLSEKLPPIRLTPADLAAVHANAAARGMDVTDFCRRAILGKPMPSGGGRGNAVIPSGLLHELSRIGNNLNQVAHAANLARPLPAIAAQTLAELRGLVALITSRLDSD